MAFRTVFERVELKYIISREQKNMLLGEMEGYMSADSYGRSVIRNIYYDTDSYLLIRRSVEKPVYKEKLRIRSYSRVSPEDTVFVELKKKYNGIVYKRRLSMPARAATEWLGGDRQESDTQIEREIDYFCSYYKTLRPRVFLSYEREAYYSRDGSDLRVTFDESILCRTQDLSLESEVGGRPLLDENNVLMEIKCSGGIPLWLCGILSRERIYKTSFSKYGEAYKEYIFPKLSKDRVNKNV